jgi:hypothetical protein
VEHVSRLGVEAITGKPDKPTAHGKNERFHQTLFRYLDKQPLADTLAGLQAQVDAFDHVYNTQRPHQGLPGRVAPQVAWEATAKAQPPRPMPDPPLLVQATARQLRPVPAGARVRKLTGAGTFMLAGVHYKVDGRYGFEEVVVVIDGDKITVTDLHGEILIEHTRPAPGVTYVGVDALVDVPRPPKCHRSPETSTVTDVLMQNCHPCPETSQILKRTWPAHEHGFDPGVVSCVRLSGRPRSTRPGPHHRRTAARQWRGTAGDSQGRSTRARSPTARTSWSTDPNR